jgi:hypothetical protein
MTVTPSTMREFFQDLEDICFRSGFSTQVEIAEIGRDVHLFARQTSDPRLVVHVHGDCRESDANKAYLTVTRKNYSKMLAERRKNGVSVGGEDAAIVDGFPIASRGMVFGYHANVILNLIKDNY